MGWRISRGRELERESGIGRHGNSAKEKKQFYVSVLADFFDYLLPAIAGFEQDALGGCAIFGLGHLDQNPLIGKISFDGFDRVSFHQITRLLSKNWVCRLQSG
jgi:hypothetical protein